MKNFEKEKIGRVLKLSTNQNIIKKSKDFFLETVKNKYSYNFNWLGFPIIQYPQDLLSLQEIIYETKPNKIIETGIARGGFINFFVITFNDFGKRK